MWPPAAVHPLPDRQSGSNSTIWSSNPPSTAHPCDYECGLNVIKLIGQKSGYTGSGHCRGAAVATEKNPKVDSWSVSLAHSIKNLSERGYKLPLPAYSMFTQWSYNQYLCTFWQQLITNDSQLQTQPTNSPSKQTYYIYLICLIEHQMILCYIPFICH